MHQQGGRPGSFSWEWSSGVVVNQTDQIQVVVHGRELASDRLQRQNESSIVHGRNSAIKMGCPTMDFQRAVSSVLTDCLSRGDHSNFIFQMGATVFACVRRIIYTISFATSCPTPPSPAPSSRCPSDARAKPN